MSCLSTAGLVIGVITFGIFLIALLPCLGAINYLNIPFAIVGVVLNGLVLTTVGYTEKNVFGLVLCTIAIGVGLLRLIMGMGVL